MDHAVSNQLSVVVVDDDIVFREWICATVAKLYDLVLYPASSSRELFRILSETHIDCIVLDYDLGEVSGLAIKQSLDDEYPNHPPVIMITGDARERTVIRAFRLGVDDYLPKRGLRPQFVAATILKVIEKWRRKSQVTS